MFINDGWEWAIKWLALSEEMNQTLMEVEDRKILDTLAKKFNHPLLGKWIKSDPRVSETNVFIDKSVLKRWKDLVVQIDVKL